MIIDLAISQINDPITRHNFQKLLEEFGKNPFLNSTFRIYDGEVTKTETAYKIKHNLGFVPTDAFISFVSNDASVAVDFQNVDKDFLVVSVSKACTFRIIAGGFLK